MFVHYHSKFVENGWRAGLRLKIGTFWAQNAPWFHFVHYRSFKRVRVNQHIHFWLNIFRFLPPPRLLALPTEAWWGAESRRRSAENVYVDLPRPQLLYSFLVNNIVHTAAHIFAPIKLPPERLSYYPTGAFTLVKIFSEFAQCFVFAEISALALSAHKASI